MRRQPIPRPLLCRCLLTCLGLASLAVRVLSAEVLPDVAEARWTNLLEAEAAFFERAPSSLESKEFDEFLRKGRQEAGELADQFRLLLASAVRADCSRGRLRVRSNHFMIPADSYKS